MLMILGPRSGKSGKRFARDAVHVISVHARGRHLCQPSLSSHRYLLAAILNWDFLRGKPFVSDPLCLISGSLRIELWLRGHGPRRPMNPQHTRLLCAHVARSTTRRRSCGSPIESQRVAIVFRRKSFQAIPTPTAKVKDGTSRSSAARYTLVQICGQLAATASERRMGFPIPRAREALPVDTPEVLGLIRTCEKTCGIETMGKSSQ